MCFSYFIKKGGYYLFIFYGLLFILSSFMFVIIFYLITSEILEKYENEVGISHINLNNTRECNNCGFVNNEYYLLNYNLTIGKLSEYIPTKDYECPVCTESKGHKLVDLSLNKTFALKKYGVIDHIKLIIKLKRIKQDKINKITKDFEVKQLTIIQDNLNNNKYVVKDGVLTVEKIK